MTPRNPWLWSFRSALTLLALFAMAPAAEAQPAEAPPHIRLEIPQVRLAGQDTFRWFGLSIYTAQLWVGPQGYRTQAPQTAGFALDLRYARSLYGKKIAESSIDEIRKLGLGTATQQQSWLEQMIRLFPDVREGNRITGIHLPGAGVRFYLDARVLGDIADTAFALAFFAIWLDPKTSAPSLRAALLANAMATP